MSIGTVEKARTLLLLAGIACTAACGADPSPGTQPLHYGVVGIYDKTWGDYVLEHPKVFDFIIYQARLQKRGAGEIVPELKEIAAAKVGLIVNVQFYEERAQRGNREGAPAMLEPQHYEGLFASLLDATHGLPLGGLTIEEENIYWDGRAEFLSDLYTRVKRRYPDYTFYQWYSPRRKPSIAIPGKTWPSLPADGWVIDQYGIYGKDFQDYIGQMKALNKPLLAVVWASPQIRVGDHTASRDDKWWDAKGWQMTYSQLAVYQKYDVPVTFYMFAPRDGSEANTPLYQSKESCDTRFVEAFTSKTVPMVRSKQPIRLEIPKRRPEWIPGHCG